jgi:hypothetical protein
MKKKIIAIAAFMVMANLFGCSADKSKILEELPPYDTGLEVRVIDSTGTGLTVREKEQLTELSSKIGSLLYNVGENYDPQDVDKYVEDTTADDLKSLAEFYLVKSEILSSQVLDIRMSGGSAGNMLVCYLLDYENKSMAKNKYIFVMDISFVRTDNGWVCTEIISKGSAAAEGSRLFRDDMTGDIKLIPKGE